MKISEFLIKNGVSIYLPCNGEGICKGCRVCLPDKREVLACCTEHIEGLSASDYEPLFFDKNKEIIKNEELPLKALKNAEGIAIDIGTTTVYSYENGFLSSALNSQRAHGSDVMSRLKFAEEGGRDTLFNEIREDLYAISPSLKKLKEENKKAVISGNTVMIHFLLNYDISTLSKAPFTPFKTSPGEIDNIYYFPSISGFLGGDTVAGIYYLDLLKEKEPFLFIDLGTNAEIVMGGGDHKAFSTSAAAGSAFDTSLQIFGTDMLRIVSSLLKEGIIDENGTFKDDCLIKSGYEIENKGRKAFFSQDDIRTVQLSKAAIRTGIETLLLRAKFSPKDIKKIYISGNFGENTDISVLKHIGMLPFDLSAELKVYKNTSLYGGIKLLSNYSVDEIGAIEDIKKKITPVNMSLDGGFNELFISHINF